MATNSSKKSTSKKTSSSSKKTSTPNYQKKAVKEVKKLAKKNPKVFIIILLVVLVAIGIGLAVYFIFLRKDKNTQPQTASEGITINFLELGNYNTGDCTYIKAGDVDILIDAGSKNESVETTIPYINQYCTDGKLEYVIATHAHEDHIAGFYSTNTRKGIFDTYKIGTLIDFPKTKKDGTKETTLYGKYVKNRDTRIASGDIEHYYTALECVEQTNGAQKEYAITDSIKMTILDQKFYHQLDTGTGENNYSVCTLFTHGSNNYLFTGDLEKTGEESLVERNNLPHCQLFKGGHHGSGTSNTDTLLDKITPETVCICCCAGNDEYTDDPLKSFPYQETIDRLAKHTNKIYVTTVTTDGHTGYTSMNGNIIFKCEDGINYSVTGTNNSIILKETEWFKNNRTWPIGGK